MVNPGSDADYYPRDFIDGEPSSSACMDLGSATTALGIFTLPTVGERDRGVCAGTGLGRGSPNDREL